MSYHRAPLALAGFGGMPPTAYAVTVGRAVLKDGGGSGVLASPEAQLAATVFESAMNGNPGAATAAISQAGAAMASAGAAAACAATGAGAAVAPLCAMAGSFIFGKVSSFLGGGGGKPCLDAQEEMAQAQIAPYLGGGPANTKLFCDGDAGCNAAVEAAAYGYADRANWWCSMAYGWPLTPTIQEEAKKLGLPVWPPPDYAKLGHDPSGDKNRAANAQYRSDLLRYKYFLHDPRWAAFAKQKFLGEVTNAVAKRKLKAWTKAAADAKALADSEYDVLVKTCTLPGVPPPIRVKGRPTACEQKAANTATIIASRAYLYSVIDGAPAILASETAAIRQDFRDEITQDLVGKTNAATSAALRAELDQAARDDRANDIKAAAVGHHRQNLLGIGLLAVAALGGVYVYSQAPRFRKNGRKNGRRR